MGFGFVIPFLPFYIQELGVTDPNEVRYWSGLVAAAPALTMGLMAPVWGLIADRFGRKLMLLRAMLSGAIIIAMMSFARSVEGVLALRALQGALTGTVAASGALVATSTPAHKLSYALGLQASSNFIGISLGPFAGGLAGEFLGYRSSFLFGAAILMVGFFVVLRNIEERPVPEEKPKGAIDAGSGGGSPAFRVTRSVVGLFALIFLMRFLMTMIIPFLPLYVQQIRGSIEGSAMVAGSLSGLTAAATAAAGLTVVRLGDRTGPARLSAVLALAGAVLSLPIFWIHALLPFGALLTAASYFYGGITPLIQSALTVRVSAARRGLLFGVLTMVGNAGWFLAPLVGSAIAIHLSINHIFLLFAAILLIAAVIAGLVGAANEEKKSVSLRETS